jgi:hypothetical protein
MAGPQSQLQNFIQNTAGTQTTAQSAVPGAVNNGNPNTVYNWSTYLPTVTPGPQPSVNFDLLTAQAPASSPGYTPPFTADPYAAMVMQGLPRASSNANVDRILSGLFGGGGTGGGFNPNPSPGGPGTGTPGTPPPGGVMPGPNGRPPQGGPPSVGDLSRPIHTRPWQGMDNFNNAQPNTGAGVGRSGALPWAQTSWGSTPLSGQPGGADVLGALQGLGNSLTGSLRDSFNQLVGDISGQNGWQGLVGLIADAFIPGGSMIINQLFPRNDPTSPMNPEQLAQMNQRLAQQLSGLVQQVQQEGGANAQARLESLLQRGSLPAGWGDEEMSQADWRNLQRSGQWNDFFSSRGTGSINPITGLPSTDARGDFMNQLSAEAMAMFEAMNRNRGDQRR